MTWQGGKTAREAGPASPFAPLKPLADQQDAPARALELLGEALGDFPTPVRLHVRLLAGEDGEQVEHWEVPAGSKDAKAKRAEPQDADVIVVMRPETWMQIAQGTLAPYEALYTGRLRVGGDFEAAKAITKYLSDPASPYVPPC